MPGAKLNWWESILFLIFLLIAGFILVSSPLFEIDTITVEGNHLLTAEEVRSTSGIVPGSNIFRVRLAEAGDRLEALPLIRQAELVRKFPSTVGITIVERVPVVLLNIEGEFWEVDVEAVPLRRKGPGWDRLPVITGAHLDSPDLQRVLDAVVMLPEQVVGDLSEVFYGDDLRVTLYTYEGIEVRLGQVDRFGEKGEILLEVLNVIRQGGQIVEYIDLSEPQKAVVKYAGGGGNDEE